MPFTIPRTRNLLLTPDLLRDFHTELDLSPLLILSKIITVNGGRETIELRAAIVNQYETSQPVLHRLLTRTVVPHPIVREEQIWQPL